MAVQWSDELAIGIGIIDDQHRKLIERFASFSKAVDEGDMRKVEETVNYLVGYAIQHFGAEELIMIRNCYDQFKEHRDEHSWFIKRVYDAYVDLAGNKSFTSEQAEQLRDMLLEWILDHIMVKDKRIAIALDGAGCTGEEDTGS
ncbi:MAG: hemerythrin family protein [Synergistaceae bacterium]|nr:hemerythrin family protein [Synergistota bacterium]NLM70742.1 hemerythrin family protein [Synergistaceae bacterium]